MMRVLMARKTRIFDELKGSLEDALKYEQGTPLDLRVTDIPLVANRISPAHIRQIRRSLRASQPVFAMLLNVSTNTVQSWEQGVRRPRKSALKLLSIAGKNPRALLDG
jgi:putative transcriptional regulator